MVSVLAFYSDDPSSIPACYLNFMDKKAGVGPCLKKEILGQPISAVTSETIVFSWKSLLVKRLAR